MKRKCKNLRKIQISFSVFRDVMTVLCRTGSSIHLIHSFSFCIHKVLCVQMAHIEFMRQENGAPFCDSLPDERNRQRQLYLSIYGSRGSGELTVCMLSFLQVSLTFVEGLLTLTNLAGCCWRTRDYERAQCMEKGPCGGFSAPILPLPSSAATNALLDLCLLISVSMVKRAVL